MGMGRAFDRATADFEYLSHKAGVLKLHLSVVAHKATVEVDEYNAKNTPPVAVEAHPRATKSPLVSFNANQAFLFLVRHNETGAILLMGRVVDPRVPAGAGPPAGKYAAQIEKLESADIAAEVEAALAKGDRRFIGVMGVGFMVSGVPDYSKKYARADVRVLPNTSDAIDGPEHLRLQEAARRYAEQYNKLLLERRRDKEEAGK
jgi:hypothetical protein